MYVNNHTSVSYYIISSFSGIVTGTSTKIDVPTSAFPPATSLTSKSDVISTTNVPTSAFPPATSLTLKSDVISTTVTSSMITVVPTASSTIATSSTGGNTGTNNSCVSQ